MDLTVTERERAIVLINSNKKRNGPQIKPEDIDFMLMEIRKENHKRKSTFIRRLSVNKEVAIKYLYNLYFKNL